MAFLALKIRADGCGTNPAGESSDLGIRNPAPFQATHELASLPPPPKWSKPDHTARAVMMMPDPRRCDDRVIGVFIQR